jgi:hypothetical protein
MQWISVEDELPKAHNWYLVWIKETEKYKGRVDMAIYSDEHGGWLHGMGTRLYSTPSHWMPLPEPPEGN